MNKKDWSKKLQKMRQTETKVNNKIKSEGK